METKSYRETLEFLRSYIQPTDRLVTLPLAESLGLILAQDIISPLDLPRFSNSAMDGWAFGGADIRPEGFTLSCVGSSFAGHPFNRALKSGECVRIMTGGAVPEGADTVVKQEIATSEGTQVFFPADVRKGDNVRIKGEEVAAGSVCLHKGIRLHAGHINFLASLGIAEVCVYRKLKIGFFSTGDELVGLGRPLSEGKIYDSNRYCIRAMIEEAGFEPVDFGVFPDDEQKLTEGVLSAAQDCDAVITSGGVSVGEADFTRKAVEANGELIGWHCLIKPGKPLAVGKIGSAYFFGLPGNPTAAQVTFHAVVSLALRRLAGEAAPALTVTMAYCESKLKKRPGYTDFQRGVISWKDGRSVVVSAGSQKTGAMRSMVDANCFIMLPDDFASVEPGTLVPVISLFGACS